MYDYLRENDPIYWDEHNEVWYAFRYDNIVEISRNPEDFCSTEGNRPRIPPDPSMIHQDGTQHSKQRGLVSKGFTPRAMRQSAEYCEQIVAELVDTFVDRGELDIVDDFASLVPAMLIADMLGVSRSKRPTLRRWIGAMVPGGQGPQYVTDEVNDAFGEFCEHHETMVDERRDELGQPPSVLASLISSATD